MRHRHGLPWYAAQIPRWWHSCRPQTIELRRANGSLIGICHCACGAVTDRAGRWVGRNSRWRIPDHQTDDLLQQRHRRQWTRP